MSKPLPVAIDDLYETVFVDYGIDPRTNVLHERTRIEDEIYTFRFANVHDKTNCLIRVDKDQT